MGKIHFILLNWNWIYLFYLYSDFTTSADFEELWNPVSEKLEIKPKPTSVSSVLQETPTPQNTKDAEKKLSLLKTLLKNSTPSTKSITTTTASTSVKKPNVPISSTPVVSEENDCKLQKYLLKGKDTFVWCYKYFILI